MVFNPRHNLIQARKQPLRFTQNSLHERNTTMGKNVLTQSHPRNKPTHQEQWRKEAASGSSQADLATRRHKSVEPKSRPSQKLLDWWFLGWLALASAFSQVRLRPGQQEFCCTPLSSALHKPFQLLVTSQIKARSSGTVTPTSCCIQYRMVLVAQMFAARGRIDAALEKNFSRFTFLKKKSGYFLLFFYYSMFYFSN